MNQLEQLVVKIMTNPGDFARYDESLAEYDAMRHSGSDLWDSKVTAVAVEVCREEIAAAVSRQAMLIRSAAAMV